jgi:hypothetical protein
VNKNSDRPFLEAVLENSEAAFDLLTDNEAVKAIPVVGTAFKLCKGLDDLRSRALAAKLRRFLDHPQMRDDSIREKIKRNVQEDPDNAARVGETLFLVLDRFVDLDKPVVLSKVFVAYLDGLMNASELRRLAQAVDVAFGDDLRLFLQASEAELADEGSYWMALLEPAGLTQSSVPRAPPGRSRLLRSVTPLGQLLRKAWKHGASQP